MHGREAVSLVHKYHWSIARHFATSQSFLFHEMSWRAKCEFVPWYVPVKSSCVLSRGPAMYNEPWFRIFSVSAFSELPVCNPHASWRKVGLKGELQPHIPTLNTLVLQGQLSNRQVIVWHVALLVGLLALPVAVIFILQLGPCESLSLSLFLSSCFFSVVAAGQWSDD